MYEEFGRDNTCMKSWVETIKVWRVGLRQKKYEELGRDNKCMKSSVGTIKVWRVG